MPNRQSYAFTISGQHRREIGEELQPGSAVVATLTMRARAQLTPEELTPLGSGIIRHQWGLGIGPNICNKLYVMHRALDGSFDSAQLAIQIKTNVGQSTSDECHENGYTDTEVHYEGPDLRILVVSRSDEGEMLNVRAYDVLGATLLSESFSMAAPDHWEGHCGISLRGDNCLADGVITV